MPRDSVTQRCSMIRLSRVNALRSVASYGSIPHGRDGARLEPLERGGSVGRAMHRATDDSMFMTSAAVEDEFPDAKLEQSVLGTFARYLRRRYCARAIPSGRFKFAARRFGRLPRSRSSCLKPSPTKR